MIKKLKFLLYIVGGTFVGLGLFVLTDLLVQLLQASGSDMLEERKNTVHSRESRDQEVKPMKRQRGPRIWTTLTKNWVPGTAVSKKDDFPGYNDPIPSKGTIRGRRSKSKTSVGSALAISPNGVWLTAKHVVEDCKDLVIQAGLKNGKPANLKPIKITTHRNADVAVITSPRTDYNREPFLLAARGDRAGDAFHIGFPRGKPGAVHSRFLGRMNIRRSNVRNSRERVLVWAEATRIPNFSGILGGISGGAVVDRTGALIGINSAASARRGRIMTSRPDTLADVIGQSGYRPKKAPDIRPVIHELSAKRYPAYARAAIQDRRVIRVICRRRS